MRNGGGGRHLHKGNLYSTLKQIGGRQRAFNQLPSAQNNPMTKWYILACYTLNPFMVEVRVQSEGPRPTLSIEPKQILMPTTSTPSSQMFIQITFVYKEQQTLYGKRNHSRTH